MVTIRPYTAQDFPTVEGWWRAHHGNDFKPQYPARDSYMIENDGRPAAFFGMVPMTPAFCYLAFPLLNTELGKEERGNVLDFMLDAVRLWAMAVKIPIVYYSGNGESFLNRLGKKGWISGETGCQHMFLTVGDV